VPDAKKVLLTSGGWQGHQPETVADCLETGLLSGYEVTRARGLDVLSIDVLQEFDLLIPVWTFGSITATQEHALLESVAAGLGYLGLHGNASAFLSSRLHKFMLGGQFVDHPGGDKVDYTVRFRAGDPIVQGLGDLDVSSEQYYLLVDPAVTVLATTDIVGGPKPWLAGTEMPVAWKRMWGRGKVFYCALGHSPDTLSHPAVQVMLKRAIDWACRTRVDIQGDQDHPQARAGSAPTSEFDQA